MMKGFDKHRRRCVVPFTTLPSPLMFDLLIIEGDLERVIEKSKDSVVIEYINDALFRLKRVKVRVRQLEEENSRLSNPGYIVDDHMIH